MSEVRLPSLADLEPDEAPLLLALEARVHDCTPSSPEKWPPRGVLGVISFSFRGCFVVAKQVAQHGYVS
jgi:hypothetical protein